MAQLGPGRARFDLRSTSQWKTAGTQGSRGGADEVSVCRSGDLERGTAHEVLTRGDTTLVLKDIPAQNL